MKRKIPDKLYKYRSFNDVKSFFKVDPITGEVSYSDFGLDGLSKGQIWFSHLDKLNDPYENEYDFDYADYLNDLQLYLSSLPKNLNLHLFSYAKSGAIFASSAIVSGTFNVFFFIFYSPKFLIKQCFPIQTTNPYNNFYKFPYT